MQDVMPVVKSKNLQKLASGSNLLKGSRLGGDVDSKIAELFT